MFSSSWDSPKIYLPPLQSLVAHTIHGSPRNFNFKFTSLMSPKTVTKSLPCTSNFLFNFLSITKVRIGCFLRGGGSEKANESDIDDPETDEDDIFKPKKAPPFTKNLLNNSIPKLPSVFECCHCHKKFMHYRSKNKHEKTCSSSSSATIPTLKVCQNCKVGFTSQGNLNRHLKGAACNPLSTKYTECYHPKCDVKFYTRLQAVEHLEREHFQEKNRETLKFDDEESFKQWRKEEDMKKFMSTVTHRGAVTCENVKYVYFCCNFDTVEKRKTNVKHRVPSCKCPARLLIKKFNDNSYQVHYIKSHAHTLDAENLQHHQYRKESLDFIRTNLDIGVSVHKIRELLVPPDDDIKKFPIKEHFISHRHIRNVRYKQLLSVQLHPNDAEAVRLLANKMKLEHDSVLVYKPQGEATEIGNKSLDKLENSSSLFAFGFQNKRMLNELKLAQSRLLCIDATFNTNQYSFYLLNLIVPDEYGHGYPVAHFICNCLDTATMTCLFSQLYDKCPDLKVICIMTDDDKCTWQAFSNVFGAHVIHLLCHWHIERAWQKNLHSYIKDEALKLEIYKVLKTLLREINTNHFNATLSSFIDQYSNIPGSANFISYFESNYANRAKLWAQCFRMFPHAKSETNMLCESFHSALKRSGLHRKVNSRLDNLIEVLKKFEYNKYLDLHTLRTFKKPPIGMGDPNSLERHNRGLQILNSQVSHQISGSKEQYIVKSASRDNVEHTVTVLDKTCAADHCYVKCLQKACAGLCYHLYVCSCEDQVVLCKHIHKVHSMILKCTFKATSAKVDESADEPTDQPDEEWKMNTSPSKQDVPFSIDKLEEMKRVIIGWFHETETDMRNDDVRDNCVPFIYGHMKLIRSAINSVKSKRITLPPNPTMDYSKIPPNQKAQKQMKLYRTVKKRKVQPPFFKHPSDDAQTDVKVELIDLSSDSSQNSEDERDIEARIASKWAKLTEIIIRISDSIQLSLVDMKTLNDRLPPKEVKDLFLRSGGRFQLGWLADSVIDAFLHIICQPHANFIPLETWVVQSVTSTDIRLDNNWFVKQNYDEKTIILLPANPTGDHWILFVIDLVSKKIFLLDPMRPEKKEAMFVTNKYGRQLEKEKYRFFAQRLKDLSLLKFGGSVNDWLVSIPDHCRQKDSINCGVFVCWFVEQLLHGQDLIRHFDPHEYRRYICRTITESGSYNLNVDVSF